MKILKHKLAVALLAASVTFGATTQAAETAQLEVVTEFTDYRGAGITITPAGRIIVSMHPLDGPTTRVVEVMANGTKQAFPTTDWADGPNIGKVGFHSVIGVHSDSKGVVWILDMGGDGTPAKLVAWDSVTNELVNTIELDKSALLDNSFLQDFVIDEKHNKIYIADMSFGNFIGATKPAFVVVDLQTNKAKRVLQGASQLMPEALDIVIEASPLASKSEDGQTNTLRFGLNPIAIDDSSEWVYFGAFSGTKIYRVPAATLADTSLSNKAVASKIETFGPKNPSDGIAYAPGGGILVTDLQNSAVGLTTQGEYKILVQDKVLSWPDSIAVSDGWVYVTQDQLHQHPAFSQGYGNTKPPYKLTRFRYKAK
ncbi:MAG: major royal jelly family protein [Paraglaciecola sp.]|nr:major royal jelly family protein [Paraglaciecola sp.]